MMFAPPGSRSGRLTQVLNRAPGFDAERTVLGFAGRLRSEVDIATVLTDLHEAVHEAIRPTRLGLWLRVMDDGVTTSSTRREP
jgi:hypothetical protein